MIITYNQKLFGLNDESKAALRNVAHELMPFFRSPHGTKHKVRNDTFQMYIFKLL